MRCKTFVYITNRTSNYIGYLAHIGQPQVDQEMFLYNQDITKTFLMVSNARHCGVPTNTLNTVV